MQNVVLTTRRVKSKTIERFVDSLGIGKYISLNSCELLADALLTSSSCSLYIFDFIFDLGVVNTIREFKERIESLHVYVTNTDAAKAYLPLTDDVFVMPDLYDVMAWFWNSDACRATNVLKFEEAEQEHCVINNPALGDDTKTLKLSINLKPIKFESNGEDDVGTQLVLSCKTYSSDVEDILEVSHKTEAPPVVETNELGVAYSAEEPESKTSVFGKDKSKKEEETFVAVKTVEEETDTFTAVGEAITSVEETAETFSAIEETVEETAEEVTQTPLTEAVAEEKKAPVAEFAIHAEERTETFAGEKLDNEVKKVKEVAESVTAEQEERQEQIAITDQEPEPIKIPEKEKVVVAAPEIVVDKKRGGFSFFGFGNRAKQKKPAVSEENYVSFTDFTAAVQETDVKPEPVSVPSIKLGNKIIEERYNTIVEYCVAHKFVSEEDRDRIMKTVSYDKSISKDDQWANNALAEGLITEDQLIQATMAVKNIGVLEWNTIKDLQPDFQTFSLDKCKKFRFFKLVDTDPTSDRVTLVYSSSLAMLNPELYRMYENPISKITLDIYIDRKLREYES